MSAEVVVRSVLVLATLLLPACAGSKSDTGDEGGGGGFALFLTAKNFNKRFTDRFCDELLQCSRGEFTCENVGVTSTGGTFVDRCDFDRGRARECLRGEWRCNPDFGFPEPPLECGEVFTNCQGSTFTTTGSF